MNFAAGLIGSTEQFLFEAGDCDTGISVSRAVQECAGFWLDKGLKQGDRVVVGCDISASSAVAYLGAIFAGLTVLPVDRRALLDGLLSGLMVFNPKAVWIKTGQIPDAEIEVFSGNLRSTNLLEQATPVNGSEVAVFNMTSGSTAEPKFVGVTHSNLLANTAAIVRSQGLDEKDRAMLVLPIHYCYGASVLHSHLAAGGDVVFDSRFMFADKVLDAINKLGCTTFAGVPTTYTYLLNHSNFGSVQLSSLKRFLQAGGALDGTTFSRIEDLYPDVNIYVMYGQSEATARITTLPPTDLSRKQGSVGKALDNLEIAVVNDSFEPVPTGEEGELIARGKSICREVFDFQGRPVSALRDGWLLTGDIATIDDEGYVWIRGRRTRFVKIRGVRVSLAAIEETVKAVTGVSDSAAIGVKDSITGESFALYVTIRDGEDAESVKSLIADSLPSKWNREKVEVMKTLPKTDRGKIDFKALERRYGSATGN